MTRTDAFKKAVELAAKEKRPYYVIKPRPGVWAVTPTPHRNCWRARPAQ